MSLISYYGELNEDGSFGEVTVRDHVAGVSTPLTHYVKHSPDGFAWGYEGSGPADLARCILIDALTKLADPESEQTADLYYQDFKREIVSRMHRKGSLEITGEAVIVWLSLAGFQA